MTDPAPPSANAQRLEALLDAHHACITIATREEGYSLELIRSAVLRTGHRLLIWSATRGVHGGLFEDDATVAGTEHPAAALYHFANQLEIPALCVALDLVPHLDDPRTLRALRDVIQKFHDSESALIMIDHGEDLPEVVAQDVVALELALPDRAELEQIVKSTLRELHRKRPIEARASRRELDTMVRNLRGLTRTQARQVIADCVAEDRRFDVEDLNAILAHKRKRLGRGGVLEFIESPADLSEIGGLRRLKQWLERRRDALSDEARDFGIDAPRGVLLLGVQGAGKSLCAKATAAAWSRPLLRLDPGTLYDRFVGESERRLRESLHQAEAMAPIVLWIDEIEKGFASAAAHSSDGGLSQRMFGTLLSWMQDHEAPVFVVATANNIEALPPELLRKGRFDEIFFVDLPAADVRRDIFAIHLRKRGRDPGTFDLDRLARCSEGYSGAEIEQAVLAAMHAAFAAGRALSSDDIAAALAESPPLTVTMAEAIARLREWAKNRCVPAD